MANSKYEYVKGFERDDVLLRNTWIVVRIDGRGFSRFSDHHSFAKPNDLPALNLMNAAATAVMKDLSDLILAYGVSDEYSFVFHKDTSLFERRASKLMTTVVSTFTAWYVKLWDSFFPGRELGVDSMPTFDGRCVCYPSVGNLRDYIAWRQVDCHINNQYNTTFWALRQQGGLTAQEATQRLAGTLSSDKNEILFHQFGINYNNEPEIYRKGTTLYRNYELESPKLQDPKQSLTQDSKQPLTHDSKKSPSLQGSTAIPEKSPSEMTEESTTGVPLQISKTAAQRERKKRAKVGIAVFHGDVIGDMFWRERSWILSGRAGKVRDVGKEGDGGKEVDGGLGSRKVEVESGSESLTAPSGHGVGVSAGELV